MVILTLWACTDPAPADSGKPAATDTADSTPHVDSGDSEDSAELPDSGDSADSGDSGDTAPPSDVDGDGFAVADGDCDDADATVHPGATEDCDPVDRDCDGSAWAACNGADGSPLRQVFDSPMCGLPVGDLTGDGWNDLLTAGSYYYAVVDGARLAAGETGGDAAHWWSGGDTELSDHLMDAGDLDGDGQADLAMADDMSLTSFYIEWGPIPTDGLTTSMRSAATQWGADGWEDEEWGKPTTAPGDLDGDGRNDLMAERCLELKAGQCSLDVWFGTADRSEDRFRIALTHPGAVIDPVGDVDGDGIEDLIIEQEDYTGWFSGADFRQDGAALEDLVAGIVDVDFSAGTSIAGSWEYKLWIRTGDWDGDGYADTLGADCSADNEWDQHGRLYFLTGLGAGDATPVGTLENDSPEWQIGYGFAAWLPDTTGAEGFVAAGKGNFYDGIFDSLVYDIFPAQPLVGTNLYSELPHLTVAGITDEYPQTYWLHGGATDVDGDGLADLAVRSADNTYLLPGVDFPWDEPDFW